MELIRWKNEYSVNVREIDEQHKKLISLINRLADAMSVGKGRDVLDGVMAEMMDYTEYHFEAEEHLLQRHGYSEAAEHKKAHAELVVRAKEIKETAEQGGRKSSVDVMLFLSSWLDKHILQEDRKFGAYLEKKVRARKPRRAAHERRP
jgi:hemerythrin-like metal-binding protein